MKQKITLFVLLFISTLGFSQVTTFTGSGNWENPGNWDFGVPTASHLVIINGNCIITDPGAVANTITFGVGFSLVIEPTATLTVTNSINQTAAVTIRMESNATNSASVIVGSDSETVQLTYQRYLSGGVWHLISSPLSSNGATVADFITAHGAAMTQSGVKYSLGTYDNAFAADGSSTWKNYTTDGSNPPPATAFTPAKGYEVLMNANGTVDFIGNINTATTNFTLTENVTGWNLIGNPYPSSVYANTNAHATDNFLTVNTSQLDPSFVSVYVWNPTNGSYTVYNQASGSTSLAPGQAFFVKSKSGGGTASFTTVMRNHQSANNFQKATSGSTPTVNLTLDNNSGTVRSTEIKYMSSATLGLDAGYDAGQFGGVGTNTFNLYTQLVQDNGVKFALQVVPDTDYDTTVIPIGVTAKSGTQLTFKATATSLPTGVKVFLEDKLLSKVTEINQTDKTYSVSINSDLTGTGRFYLHTLGETLSIDDDVVASNYKLAVSAKQQSMRLYGAVTQKGSMTVFDTFGRKIYSKKLQTGTEQNISLPTISTGIYIVKFNIDNKSFTKKILWN